MQQSTACLHCVWRTTSLCVGGRAARRSCLRRGGGGRQAGATVLSCLVWRCELTAGQVRSASECVQRSHCAARHTPTQNAPVCRSVHIATPDTTRQSCLRRVRHSGVNGLQVQAYTRACLQGCRPCGCVFVHRYIISLCRAGMRVCYMSLLFIDAFASTRAADYDPIYTYSR